MSARGQWPNGKSRRLFREDGTWRPGAKRQYVKRHAKLQEKAAADEREAANAPPAEKNWLVPCENCGQKPTVDTTGLCGPCCFGEADTAGGNW